MFKDRVRTAFGVALMCGFAAVAAPAQTFTVLHIFTGLDGAEPFGNVILDQAGNVYGTTVLGGSGLGGTVFKIDPQGKQTILHAFSNRPDGFLPSAGLVEDAAGNFYGTTILGGAYGMGTVFKINSSSEYSVLYSFPNSGNNLPSSGLILDGSARLDGTAGPGTASRGLGWGIVFRINTEGKEEKVLYRFRGPTADGSIPCGTLLRTGSGSLYGTTYSGGAHNLGTVFELNNKLLNKTLFSFAGGKAGKNPCSGVVRDAAGNLYGTTPAFGIPPHRQNGTIFRIAADGTHTVVHAFTGGADGGDPESGLAIDKAGNFYGTTYSGGAHHDGTVYRIDKSGVLTVLYSFTGGSEGANPIGVTLDANGNLYGTTAGGGQGYGTVFKLTLSNEH